MSSSMSDIETSSNAGSCISEIDRVRLMTLPEVAAVRRKIANVASSYDPERTGRILRAAFEGEALDPTALTEQLRRTLGVQLSPAELGALVTLFDRDGDGSVSCAEFLSMFFKEGRAEKARSTAVARAERARRDAKRAARVEAKVERLTALT